MSNYNNQPNIEYLEGDIEDFISNFTDNIHDSYARKDIIVDYIDVITDSVPNVYDREYEALIPAINKLLDVMCTSKFASAFKQILEDEMLANYDDYRNKIAQVLTILLHTSHDDMSQDTEYMYINDILRRLWKKEVRELINRLDITEELAIELLIGIPIYPDNIKDKDLDRLTTRFKMAILRHSHENLDVLGKQNIGLLLDYFFSKGSKTCLKALGKFFIKPKDNPEEILEYDQVIYDQFVNALYEKLNNYDIGDIQFCLSFVVRTNKRKKENNERESLFDVTLAMTHENIRKAIARMISKDETTTQYL